jgi:putative ABC transport system permease protein
MIFFQDRNLSMLARIRETRWYKKLNSTPKENVLMALANLRTNKMRSILTVLGIVVGVATVVVIASILTGMRSNLEVMIQEFGTNNIWAFHLTTGPRIGNHDPKEWNRKSLTVENAQALKLQAPAVSDVAWRMFDVRTSNVMTYGGNTYKQGFVSAVSPNYAQVAHLSLEQGRFFIELDDLHRRNVVVIGPKVAKALFPVSNQIAGKEVMLGGRRYELVGVLDKPKASFLGESRDDNAIYIPHRTALKFSPEQRYLMLIIQAHEGKLPAALQQAEAVLRRERGVKFNEPNNFDLNTAERFIQQFDAIFATLGLVAIAISAVGLLVGGIGVMNIMLVSVTERTREIGIRKAIGAKRRDIITQFLFEAMTLTAVGGVIGLLLSLMASVILYFIFPNMPSTIPAWAVIAGLSISVLIGLIFGVWPARQASRLDPIECLRYE